MYFFPTTVEPLFRKQTSQTLFLLSLLSQMVSNSGKWKQQWTKTRANLYVSNIC